MWHSEGLRVSDSTGQPGYSGERDLGQVHTIKIYPPTPSGFALDNEQLLELVGNDQIPATGRFVARDKLILNTSNEADIRIGWFGTTFGILFSDKVEDPFGASELRCHRLRKPLTDGAVIAGLSKENNAELVSLSEEFIELFVAHERATRALVDVATSGDVETSELASEIKNLRSDLRELRRQRDALINGVETSLAQLFALLERQGKGEDGVLLVNGLVNIFYVRDINGVLSAAHVMWSSDGWLLYWYAIERPHRWSDGYQVFSQA